MIAASEMDWVFKDVLSLWLCNWLTVKKKVVERWGKILC